MKVFALAAAIVALTGCTAPVDAASATLTSRAKPPAVKLITTGRPMTHSVSELRVAAKGKSAYSRTAYGDWADPDRNGCDARNDVLRRDLSKVVLRKGSSCIVASGTLRDRYTGNELEFVRGQATSRYVQIDHVVPVADADKSGAHGWPAAKKAAFYNDPMNLIAVEGFINQFKGAKTAENYLPPLNGRAYACTVVEVKAKYGLTVSPAEFKALKGACR